MRKFVVLDHLLRSVGSHHFEYDMHVLRAAESQGWQSVLGSHRTLGNHPELAGNWRVFRSFRGNISDYDSLVIKLLRTERKLAAAEATHGALAFAQRDRCRFDLWRYQRRFERLQRCYAQGLDAVWAGCAIARGDRVFVPTMTPFDIAGLTNWVRKNPGAGEVDWHLQFHFPLVEAETWYARGSRQFDDLSLNIPRMLHGLLRVLPRGRVHFHATTQSLADQYEHCVGEPFGILPLPINPLLCQLRRGAAGRKPLRATCAGEPRWEKGSRHLLQIVSILKDDYLLTGRLQLAIQARSPKNLPESVREFVADPASPAAGRAAPAPVAVAKWPLSPAEYVQYLASSDIGLFTHDPLAYHGRLSGVMVELLAAGVPVVVPAGCALADQISEPIFAHQEGQRERLPLVANLSMRELDWKVAVQHSAEQGIAVGSDVPGATVPAAVAHMAVPAGAGHLLVLLERDEPNPWNRYCSVSVEQRGADSRPPRCSRDVIGYRGPDRWMTVLVALEPRCRQIEIRFETAFGHEPFLLRRMECTFLAGSDSSRVPLGAVGRLASDPTHTAECLRDVVDHYDHYEKTTRTFAKTWGPAHSADKIVRDVAHPTARGRREAA